MSQSALPPVGTPVCFEDKALKVRHGVVQSHGNEGRWCIIEVHSRKRPSFWQFDRDTQNAHRVNFFLVSNRKNIVRIPDPSSANWIDKMTVASSLVGAHVSLAFQHVFSSANPAPQDENVPPQREVSLIPPKQPLAPIAEET